MNSSNDPSQIFIRNWEMYQKAISANYMKHQELGAISQKHLLQFNQDAPLRVLDIGCGDAHQITEQLKELNVSSYTGFDLSEQAIAIAATKLKSAQLKAAFEMGKMEELIKADKQTYNVIYSSFAIHHLTDEKKQELIHDCYSRLEQKGLFILIDIKREPAQSIDEYRSNYSNMILNDWHSFNMDEKTAIIDHLTTCDLPVETKTYIDFAQLAGFQLAEEANVDDKHALLAFTKN